MVFILLKTDPFVLAVIGQHDCVTIVIVYLSLSVLTFSWWTWVNWYQNVSILGIIGAKDDGGGGDK